MFQRSTKDNKDMEVEQSLPNPTNFLNFLGRNSTTFQPDPHTTAAYIS